MERIKKDVNELALLFDISLLLNQSKDIKDVVKPILALIASHLGLLRVTTTLLNRNNSHILIQEAFGLSEEEKNRGKYKIGEGVVGRVVESGMPLVIPKISEEPLFLNRTGSRKQNEKEDFSFVCVPIKLGEEVIGTLSADKIRSPQTNFEDEVRLLSVIASMIALSLKARQEELEEVGRLQEENERLHDELKTKFRPAHIIGNSQPMRDLFLLIERVSQTDATVLILGESGVGKELVANAIHYTSARADNNLIKVNCSALPESLIESELFGHEKGAFTGAHLMRKGRFEMANGGTLFLDEIGDLPMQTQVKILRILQERELERLGGSSTIKVNVRVIAATNRNLEQAIKEGSFREDLYYRLNVFPMFVPALRERKSDIPLLADHFIEKFNKKNQKKIKRISTSAIDMIMQYHWPGNVRELENCIERASILSTNGVIYGFHLPPTLQTPETTEAPGKGSLKSILSKVEKDLIQDTLKMTHGNIAQAAENLGITERIMGLRVAKYKIDPKRYK